MNNKKTYKIILITFVLLYIIAGVVFFVLNQNPEQTSKHLENNEGQELAMQMKNAEEKANIDIIEIENQKKEGTFDKNTLSSKVKSSKKYLEENLTDISLEKENYIKLFYHSAFLSSLSESYNLNNNQLIKISQEIHSYIIKVLNYNYDDDLEKELTKKLENIDLDSIEELINIISKQ